MLFSIQKQDNLNLSTKSVFLQSAHKLHAVILTKVKNKGMGGTAWLAQSLASYP